MPNFWDSKDFKKLNKDWQEKLKKSGFKDIEDSEDTLSVWASQHFIHRYNKVLYEAKEEYYNYAQQFLNENKFKTKLDHTVWLLHSKGVSQKEIFKLLKPNNPKLYLYKVQLIEERLCKEMKVKYGIHGRNDE